MNPHVQRYLDKAHECERLAAQARDPNTKAAFVSMSRHWRKLLISPLVGSHLGGVLERWLLVEGEDLFGVVLQLSHRQTNLAFEVVLAADCHATNLIGF